jgi:thiol-disulfide isomerase/thioredoxin
MKKIILSSLPLFVLLTLCYFGYQTYQKNEVKKVFKNQIKHLPLPTIFQWIENQPSANKNPTVVLFFHPECEHCQYEAKIITEKQKEFMGVNLWWISFADSTIIRTFSKKYGLDDIPNSYVAHLSAEKITQTFGSNTIPHIFIYNKEQVLQKHFKGETKVEAILKYL